ncbi:MAG: thioredoxin [Methanolinea sp.]|nr:thioredoxin [Methanolinea sp.]
MDDDELQRIREKKLRELEARLLEQRGKGQPQPARVLTVDESRFSTLLSGHPRLVIDFWAEWCGPCRMVAPVIGELAMEMAGRVAFGKCNTDQNPRLAARFGISAIPTILLFREGALLDRIIGAYPKETIRARIIRAFGLEG